MKLIYFCDCCQEVLDELDVEELMTSGQEDALTEEEWQGIMNMQENQGSQHFVSALCDDCIREMGVGYEENTTYKAIIH